MDGKHVSADQDSSPVGLRLSLLNHRDSLELARQAVMDFVAPLALSSKARFDVELVLEETLMNLVWHAFNDQGQHTIELSAWAVPGGVALRFVDDGVAFDPGQAKAPQLPASIAEASPGGLGLMLVRKRARSVDYERVAGRNVLTITVAQH